MNLSHLRYDPNLWTHLMLQANLIVTTALPIDSNNRKKTARNPAIFIRVVCDCICETKLIHRFLDSWISIVPVRAIFNLASTGRSPYSV